MWFGLYNQLWHLCNLYAGISGRGGDSRMWRTKDGAEWTSTCLVCKALGRVHNVDVVIFRQQNVILGGSKVHRGLPPILILLCRLSLLSRRILLAFGWARHGYLNAACGRKTLISVCGQRDARSNTAGENWQTLIIPASPFRSCRVVCVLWELGLFVRYTYTQTSFVDCRQKWGNA